MAGNSDVGYGVVGRRILGSRTFCRHPGFVAASRLVVSRGSCLRGMIEPVTLLEIAERLTVVRGSTW